MTDEFSSDSIPASPPSEHTPAPSPPPDTSEIINERRHAALSQLAKDENIEGYAQEREDQAAAIDRGEDLPRERANQWYRRAHKALTDAANEAAGIQPNGQGEQEPSAPPPGYVPGDEAQRGVERARKEGAAQLRVSQYFGNDAEKKQEIINWHDAMDPEHHVAEWVIENESVFAPQILERLSANPEALQQLASMPANQRDRWLGMLEGRIAAETNFAQQMTQQQQQWQQDRRTTKAPPPIRPPRGGANPHRDIYGLASKGEDIGDYVKARQQQEKRSRD